MPFPGMEVNLKNQTRLYLLWTNFIFHFTCHFHSRKWQAPLNRGERG